VTAGEDELKPLIGDLGLIHLGLRDLGCRGCEQPQLGSEHAVAAQPVDRRVPRRGHQPRRRPGWQAVARPAPRGGREGLRDGLLGELEVAEVADDGGQDAAPLVAEDLLKRGQDGLPMIGRTSTEPPSRTAGMRAAISVAWSRSSASYR